MFDAGGRRSEQPIRVRSIGAVVAIAARCARHVVRVLHDLGTREPGARENARRERLADIGVMAAQIAHDLGNPVAGMLMVARHGQRRIAARPETPATALQGTIDTVVTTAEHLQRMIAEIKEFVHGPRLERRAIELPALVRRAGVLWEQEASVRGITLAIDVAPDVPAVQADGEKLRRVFDNLVRNAFEAVDHGPGRVRVSVAPTRTRGAQVTVEDSGPGIPEEVRTFRLFSTSKPNGSGLGLAICKQIVEAHEGTIAIVEGTPHGAVFRVELPAAA